MSGLWQDGPEYKARVGKPFVPPSITLKEVHDAVPKHLLKHDPIKSFLYVLRDILLSLFLYTIASKIAPWADNDFGGYVTSPQLKLTLKACLWCGYWIIQSLVNAGIFCIGHDAGHGTLFSNKLVNNTIGFIFHSYLLIPYFAWRSSHHAHHRATGSIERDENYVPYTRAKYNLPPELKATKADYGEVFEETPLVTLWRMIVMQALGWWIYLSTDMMGSPRHPVGTNHFSPSSALFKPEDRRSIILSNIGIGTMALILFMSGRTFFLWYYLVPYVLANHWIVMFTYLHHSDPTIPHYRKNEWTFLRGAIATVDRPLLGWAGRFFFHNISHDHVAHHLFLRAPFYNGPEITERIKSVLQEDYNFDSTPSFYALYRSFTQCLFIEDEGDVVFYKDKNGHSVREPQLNRAKDTTRVYANMAKRD